MGGTKRYRATAHLAGESLVSNERRVSRGTIKSLQRLRRPSKEITLMYQ
jgi:hypothetical protein